MIVTIEPLTVSEFLSLYGIAYAVSDQHEDFTGGRGNDGCVSHAEGQVLAGLARKLGGPVLEIGFCLGISTKYILDGFRSGPAALQNNRIVSLDLHHQRRLPNMNLEQIVADSRIWRVADRFTWAFVDGDHRYESVVEDIETCRVHGCRGMLFHDTSACFTVPTNMSNGSDARRAVLDVLGSSPDWKVVEVLTDCGILWATRDSGLGYSDLSFPTP